MPPSFDSGYNKPSPGELLKRFWELDFEQRSREFITPKAAARKAGVHPSRARALCDEGMWPYVKIGGRIYVHDPSLLAFFMYEQLNR